MTLEVDRYDVEAMIREESSRMRGEIERAVRAACVELRADFREELDRLQRVLDALTESAA